LSITINWMIHCMCGSKLLSMHYISNIILFYQIYW